MKKMNVGAVEFTFDWDGDGVRIDRVYIDPENRGKGLLCPAILSFIQAVDAKEFNLSIRPDSGLPEDYDRLRSSFMACGFTPMELDGEIYRNELMLIKKP